MSMEAEGHEKSDIAKMFIIYMEISTADPAA